MKILLCFFSWIAAAAAHGIIGYPVAPVGYHISPLTSITRPVYTNFHPLGPYFSYGVIPNNLVFAGVPGVVHYLPLVPTEGKDKPGKKKSEDKDKKEETTEEPKKEEEESKTDETEDLAH